MLTYLIIYSIKELIKLELILGGTASLSQYAMCKAAIDSFTKNAAIAYGPLGVRVNAVR
jgi:NAD(P)-dependent dehydrogenase (short-subunit alcohol dehydrogenase family)